MRSWRTCNKRRKRRELKREPVKRPLFSLKQWANLPGIVNRLYRDGYNDVGAQARFLREINAADDKRSSHRCMVYIVGETGVFICVPPVQTTGATEGPR